MSHNKQNNSVNNKTNILRYSLYFLTLNIISEINLHDPPACKPNFSFYICKMKCLRHNLFTILPHPKTNTQTVTWLDPNYNRKGMFTSRPRTKLFFQIKYFVLCV